MTPDEVLAELHQIRRDQAALDPDSEQYRELEARRSHLADLAGAALDANRGRASLREELEHLEARLAAIDDDKIDVPSWLTTMTADGRLAINDPSIPIEGINDAIEKNARLDRKSIEARIQHLKKALAES